MSQRTLTGVFASAAVVIGIAIAPVASGDGGNVIHVPKDYETIQEAIDAAKDGDEIIVAPDTYNEAIDLLGKSIELRSSDGPEKTIIDASGLGTSVVTIASGKGAEIVIEGFTITGGSGTPLEQYEVVGGGMYVADASVTISNCRFEEHAVFADIYARGGGIYAVKSVLTITEAVFQGNDASSWDRSYGGALYTSNSNTTITDSHFIENSIMGEKESQGGAIRGASMVLTKCVFQGNESRSGHCGWVRGGAISGGDIVLDECIFDGNRARMSDDCGSLAYGGAINGSVTASNSHFIGNFATVWSDDPDAAFGNVARGGAVYGSGTYTNCVFEGNFSLAIGQSASMTGGAVHATTEPQFAESTFCQNSPTDITGAWEDAGGNSFHPPSDLNCDGVVDGADLLILLSAWGECPDHKNCPADLNGDETVDGGDLLILLSNWG